MGAGPQRCCPREGRCGKLAGGAAPATRQPGSPKTVSEPQGHPPRAGPGCCRGRHGPSPHPPCEPGERNLLGVKGWTISEVFLWPRAPAPPGPGHLALGPTSSVAPRATQSTPTDSLAPSSWPSQGGRDQAADRWFLSGHWEGRTRAGLPALQTLLDFGRLPGPHGEGAQRPRRRPNALLA